MSLLATRDQAARQLGLKSDEGALVVNVLPGSPAASGGLQNYDVITKFGEHEVHSAKDLMNAVLDQPVGKAAEVEVVRNGKKKHFPISTAENLPKSSINKAVISKNSGEGEQSPYDLGFRLSKLTKSVAQELKVPYLKKEPPVVVEVTGDSLAQKGGLHVGDIILDVNKSRVKDVKDVKRELKKGLNVLRVQRGEVVALVFMEPVGE